MRSLELDMAGIRLLQEVLTLNSCRLTDYYCWQIVVCSVSFLIKYRFMIVEGPRCKFQLAVIAGIHHHIFWLVMLCLEYG
jgi:hypothetical protein